MKRRPDRHQAAAALPRIPRARQLSDFLIDADVPGQDCQAESCSCLMLMPSRAPLDELAVLVAPLAACCQVGSAAILQVICITVVMGEWPFLMHVRWGLLTFSRRRRLAPRSAVPLLNEILIAYEQDLAGGTAPQSAPQDV